MRGFTKIVTAALLGAATLPLLASPSQAIVRRHLHCSIGATINLPTLPLVGSMSSTPFIVTNQWSFAIPANTTYTLTVGRKSWTVKNKNALGPGASFGTTAVYTDGACNVSVPG